MSRKSFVYKSVLLFLVFLMIVPLTALVPAAAQGDGKWCSGVRIRFFVGGAEGDAFASIVLRGAQAAAADLGPTVDYIFSGWNSELMIQQLREAVAARPDGIAMMGHPGDDAIMPLAEEAAAAGILMMYQNVDVPRVRAAYGGGYVGAQLSSQGRALGDEAMRQYGIQAGDTVIVVGPFTEQNRALRELGTVAAFEDAGVKVVKIQSNPDWGADPNLAIPTITAAVLDNPDAKLIAYPGGQMLGNATTYMEAAGKAAGEMINIGFDTSPLIMEAFDEGWVQLTSDQQPFLQGYVPIQSICLSKVYGFGPMNVDTGAGFVDTNNYQSVAEMARAGYR
jgi:simple sugar transport system substrate-binding protein